MELLLIAAYDSVRHVLPKSEKAKKNADETIPHYLDQFLYYFFFFFCASSILP